MSADKRKITSDENGESDCYDVTRSFGIKCMSRRRAIERLLTAGSRGEEYIVSDIRDAIKEAIEAIQDELDSEISRARKLIDKLEKEAIEMQQYTKEQA